MSGEAPVRERALRTDPAGGPGRALPIALVAFAALGLPDGMLGIAWPSMRATFDLPLAGLGQLLLAGTIGYLTGSASSGFLSDRFGTRPVLMGSALASAAAMLAFAAAPSWPLVLLGGLAAGYGGGGIDAALNAYVALRHGPRTMNLVHGCYGIGATIGPLVLTAVLAGGRSWRLPYAGLFALQLALLTAYALTGGAWGGRRPAREATARPVAIPWALVGVGLALFFVYTGVEVATGQWSYTFLTTARSAPATAAGLAVSAFWAGLTAARLAVALFGRRLGPLPLLHASVVVTLAALALFWWSPAPAVGYAGLVLAGVGFAPVFPALVTLTPRRVGEDVAARVVGLQLGAAGSGASLAPAGLGVLMQWGGTALLAPCLLAGGLALAALHVAATALARRSGARG
jgi:fucose permease